MVETIMEALENQVHICMLWPLAIGSVPSREAVNAYKDAAVFFMKIGHIRQAGH